MFYRVEYETGLTGITGYTGLTTLKDAQHKAKILQGVVVVDDNEFYQIHRRAYNGPYKTV
jgi:hypothetical protein